MRLDDQNESDNVEDRRGTGGNFDGYGRNPQYLALKDRVEQALLARAKAERGDAPSKSGGKPGKSGGKAGGKAGGGKSGGKPSAASKPGEGKRSRKR